MAEADLQLARHLRAQGIRDTRVLAAIASLDRAAFMPPSLASAAGEDEAMPIGFGQTISQPFVVAYMTEQLQLDGSEKVLEVGTGSGYQAAVLGQLCNELWSIERVPQLAWQARERLDALGLGAKVRVRVGDGMAGLREESPFDAIIVTAAAPELPPALVAQLAVGGRMVIPLGAQGEPQYLQRITLRADGTLSFARLLDVRFVPLLPGTLEPPSA